MSDEMQFSDDKKALDQRNRKLSAAIMLAVDLESSFKLYSFRCIDVDNYIHRVDELISFYKKAIKDLGDDTSGASVSA